MVEIAISIAVSMPLLFLGGGHIPDTQSMFHQKLCLSGYTTFTTLTTNRVLWRHSAGASVGSSHAIFETQLYMGSYDNHFYCLGALACKSIWPFAAGDFEIVQYVKTEQSRFSLSSNLKLIQARGPPA